MKFAKMHGNGNDFIVIEDRNNNFIGYENELARKLCDRHFGVGGDGILIVRDSSIADTKMVIINADGSYASMCGNGIRCFAKYVYENSIVKKDIISIETGDGIKEARIISELDVEDNSVKSVTINMGISSFSPWKIPARENNEIIKYKISTCEKEYCINSLLMGVPHTVIIGKLSDYNVEEGKHIEHLDLFPEGTNVNFCEIVDKNNINVKTWERGAGATLACGTGCCASVAVCYKLGLTGNSVKVQVPGGALHVKITEQGIMMTGPAVVSFIGEIEYN